MKKVIATFLTIIIIMVSLLGCQSDKKLSIKEPQTNLSSSSDKQERFQYEADVPVTPFDIIEIVENLPAYSTVEEVLDYDDTAYFAGENEYKTKYAISENRSLFELDGIVVYTFFSSGKFADVSFETPNISYEQYKELIVNLEEYMNTTFTPYLVDITIEHSSKFSPEEKVNKDFIFDDTSLALTIGDTYPFESAEYRLSAKTNAYDHKNGKLPYWCGLEKFPLYGVNEIIYNQLTVKIGFPGEI